VGDAGARVLQVYYDGACPVCRRAMGKVRARLGDSGVVYVDISAPGFDAAAYGLERAAVRRALHVRLPDGRVVRGIDAVAALWDRMGARRWLARLVRLPLLHGLSGIVYGFVARHRHLLP